MINLLNHKRTLEKPISKSYIYFRKASWLGCIVLVGSIIGALLKTICIGLYVFFFDVPEEQTAQMFGMTNGWLARVWALSAIALVAGYLLRVTIGNMINWVNPKKLSPDDLSSLSRYIRGQEVDSQNKAIDYCVLVKIAGRELYEMDHDLIKNFFDQEEVRKRDERFSREMDDMIKVRYEEKMLDKSIKKTGHAQESLTF